jgi:hypothetical protein
MVQINLDDTVTVLTGLGIIIALVFYFARLEFRLRHLENNPLLEAIKDLHKEDVIKFYRELRDNRGNE